MLAYIVIISVTSAWAVEYIDLGRSIGTDSMAWPTSNKSIYFNYTYHVVEEGYKNAELRGGWYAEKTVCLPEHISTNIDAPYHYRPDGWTLDQIPVERFFAEGIAIDISEKVEKNPFNSYFTLDDLSDWMNKNGPIPNNSVILVNTGWAKNYYNMKSFFGFENDIEDKRFPGFTHEVAEYIASLNKFGTTVYGAGIDTASLDKDHTIKVPAHRALVNENMYIIEELINLDKLPPRGFDLIVMPLKLAKGTGSPCRVIAKLHDVCK